MAEMRYREALNAALREELARDERVILMGEDIGVFGGAFKVTDGLLEEFGEQRVRDTPISENTIVGVGVGAAMTGLRPVVELMTINFALLAFDQIVNHAAHIHYMFGGQAQRAAGGAHAAGRRPPARPDALALPRVAVPARPRAARRGARHRGRREGPAEDRDPRREPGDLHRARVALRRARRGPRRRGAPRALRPGARRARGLRRDDRRRLADGADGRARRRDARGRARRAGRGDRPAHAAPARPRHDPRVRRARPTAA